MQVIVISGKARHGKDTTAGFLKSALEADGNSVLVAHYGDLVKYVCKTFFGWNGEKDEYGRTLLQKVGTDAIRAKRSDYWVSFISDIMEFFPGEWDYVLIPDCRFPNEVDYIKNAGFDAVHLRIVREGFVSPLTPEQQTHPSETALDNTPADYYIKNNGAVSDMGKAVIELLVELNGSHQTTFWECES